MSMIFVTNPTAEDRLLALYQAGHSAAAIAGKTATPLETVTEVGKIYGYAAEPVPLNDADLLEKIAASRRQDPTVAKDALVRQHATNLVVVSKALLWHGLERSPEVEAIGAAQRAAMKADLESGTRVEALAEKYKLDKHTVEELFAVEHIHVGLVPRVPIATQRAIAAEHGLGASSEKLAARHGISARTVRKLLKRRGSKLLGTTFHNQRYVYDTNAFTILPGDPMADIKKYWLGFIWADGHVRKDGYALTINLQESDRAHLEKLREHLKSDVPIAKSIHHNKDGDFPEAVLTICNKELIAAVVATGLLPGDRCKMMQEAVVPEELARSVHFWRGHVDGNGFIAFRETSTGAPILGITTPIPGVRDAYDRFCSMHVPWVTLSEKTWQFNASGKAATRPVTGRGAQALIGLLYFGVGGEAYSPVLDRKLALARKALAYESKQCA